MDRTNKPRVLPDSAFCGVTFTTSGRGPVKTAKDFVEVNLMSTEITALLSATFAHCVALECMWLPPRLTQIGKEAFLNCVVLEEVVIPTELSDMGNRAFCGCEQLQRFTPLGEGTDHPNHSFPTTPPSQQPINEVHLTPLSRDSRRTPEESPRRGSPNLPDHPKEQPQGPVSQGVDGAVARRPRCTS